MRGIFKDLIHCILNFLKTDIFLETAYLDQKGWSLAFSRIKLTISY